MEEMIEQPAEVNSQPQETVVPEQVTETPEMVDYKLDKRFGKMWKSENDIYKSYRELEKKYPETQKQLKQYQEALKKYGLDDLSKFEETAKYYIDPESDLNKFLNYLSPVLSDEKRLNLFKDYVQKQIKEMEVEKFGSHLTDEERNALKEAQQLKGKLKEMEDKQQISEYTKQIATNLNDIYEFAEENNLDFDKNAFISECQKKGVPTELMMDFFKSRAYEHLVTNEKRKAEENVIKNVKKSRVGSIPTGDKSQPSSGKVSFQRQLDEIVQKAYQ